MIGAIVSGKIADYAGRRVVSQSQATLNFNFNVSVVYHWLLCILMCRPWVSQRFAINFFPDFSCLNCRHVKELTIYEACYQTKKNIFLFGLKYKKEKK